MARITGGPTIRFVFDRDKAGELAAHLVQMAGGQMPLLKLLKLMYLVDRQSLIETGEPVTGDSIAALDKGPVLSKTYDSLKPDGDRLPYIVSVAGGGVQLDPGAPANGRLSDYEIGLAVRAYKKFGEKSGAELTALLHKHAPEWKPPPAGSSKPIDPADILAAAGKTDEEIEAVAAEARYFSHVERHLA